jgi:hypothetical protein
MPTIQFVVRTSPFVTEQGFAAPAHRLFLAARYQSALQGTYPYRTFFNTGAPYSIVPHALAQRVAWRPMGTVTQLPPGPVTAIEWQGVPCVLGELQVELYDVPTCTATQPLLLIAKIATRPTTPRTDYAATLGLNLLTDNAGRLGVSGQCGNLSGSLWVPPRPVPRSDRREAE